MDDGRGCRKPEEHHQHLCVLKARLDREELAALTRHPRYACELCGGRTERGGNLCQPRKIRR